MQALQDYNTHFGAPKGPFALFLITVRKSSCGKVMFSQLSVSHSVHSGDVHAWSQVPSRGGYAWSQVPSKGYAKSHVFLGSWVYQGVYLG